MRYLIVVENYETGETIKESVDNMDEAIELYRRYCDEAVYGDWDEVYFTTIKDTMIFGR